ncbi:unnamed protein product [Urochloa humidicola]
MAMTVEITRPEMLRPRPVGDHGAGRMIPLTVFDRAGTDDGYVPAIFAWNAQANAAVMDGRLLATVARFPHLAGRLAIDARGRRCFHLNNAGLPVLEAAAATDLANALAAHDVSEHIDQLFPQGGQGQCRGAAPPGAADTCGGLVIGTA